jgi:hypothetical protein
MGAYHCTNTDDVDMPWLYGKDSYVTLSECAPLIEKLSDEIRRVSINPRARPKSPMEKMRGEVSAILESSLMSSGDISKEIAAHVMMSCDRDTIGLLFRRAHGVVLSKAQWAAIVPHLTRELAEEMVDEGLALYHCPFPGPSMPRAEVAEYLADELASCPAGPGTLRRWISRHGEGIVDTALTARFLRRLVKDQPQAARYNATSNCGYLDSPLDGILCYLAGLSFTMEDFTNIEVSRTLEVLSLVASNHSRLRIHEAIPSLEALLDDNALLDRLQ